jgi:threonine synthase
MPAIAYLECVRCNHRLSPDTPQTLCPLCASNLYVRYDMDKLKRTARREDIPAKAAASPASLGMWRYSSVLPDVTPVTLAEGLTPLLHSKRYPHLYIKEEGTNPTGTFKARGFSLAVTMARHYGLHHLAIPTAGNAAAVVAAYAAAADIKAHIFMPNDAPFAHYLEAIAYGADVTTVNGTLADCARLIAQNIKAQHEADTPAQQLWFDLSALKEPFRAEGAKTIGYELVEQLGWQYPDAIIYPVPEAAGLTGIWKAFDEIEALNWLDNPGKRPKIYTLQTPALQIPTPSDTESDEAAILRISEGQAIAATEEQIQHSIADWATHEGILLSPEGATAAAAYDQLILSGDLKLTDKVVLINPSSGIKHTNVSTDMTAGTMHLRRPAKLPTSLPVGGIITPQ